MTYDSSEQKTQSPSNDVAEPKSLTVVVRGETAKDSKSEDSKPSQSKEKDKAPPKQVSAAKVKLQNRLPTLDDDGDVSVQKDHVVTRDGKADLAFTGTLRASAASASAPKGKWQEYRVYETNGGRHVFSKVTRSHFCG